MVANILLSILSMLMFSQIHCGFCETDVYYNKALEHNEKVFERKKPKFNCRKYHAAWYCARMHIINAQSRPIPMIQKEHDCDKILRHLYIGGYESIEYCVKRHLVDRIISFNSKNLRLIPEEFNGNVMSFYQKDVPSTDISKIYKKTIKFMLGAKRGLLIHCAKGHSRSASLCILYIMAHFDVSYEDALHYVKIHRPWVGPNTWFQEQLHDLDDFYLPRYGD
jgi:hypothetical protein